MTDRITCAPGDPRSATPEWICITGQRINPFKHRLEDGVQNRTPESEMPVVPSSVPGYVSVREATRLFRCGAKRIRDLYQRELVRSMKEGKRYIINLEDLRRVQGEAGEPHRGRKPSYQVGY